MGRHRTAEEKIELGAQARAMRAAGKSRREIQAALGIGDDLAKELLRGTELPDALRRPRAKDDHRAAAIALREAGRTYDEIVDELGVSKGSLSLWLRDLPHPTDEQREAVHGTEPTPAGGQLSLLDPELRGDRIAAARQMRVDGCLLKEIADEFFRLHQNGLHVVHRHPGASASSSRGEPGARPHDEPQALGRVPS